MKTTTEIQWHTRRGFLCESLSVAATFGILSGCSSNRSEPARRHSAKEDTDNATPAPVPAQTLKASMSCLKSDELRMDLVAWDVALTLAEFSVAAYSDGTAQAVAVEQLGAKTNCPVAKGLSHGLVASDDQTVVIAFRGTNEAADWLTNTSIMGHRVSDGKMHSGFYGAVYAIFDEVYRAAIEQGAKTKALWVTGHSLGGAMAAAFAYRAVIEKKLKVEGVVTFGQPLVFSTSLAQVMLDNFSTRYVRFVNNWDPVTRMLPNYRHAGSRVHLRDGDFEFRSPRISISAPAIRVAPAHVMEFQEIAELQPMTEAEYQEFQQRLNAERVPAEAPVAVNGPRVVRAVAAYIPLLTPHLMGTYLDHLKSIGEKNLNPPTARVVKTGAKSE